VIVKEDKSVLFVTTIDPSFLSAAVAAAVAPLPA